MNRVCCVSVGCRENRIDGELINKYFGENNWAIVDEPEDADLVVLNSCGFSAGSEDASMAVYRELMERKRPGAQLVFAGCLPAINKKAVRDAGYEGMIVTPRTMDRFDEIIAAQVPISSLDTGCLPEDPVVRGWVGRAFELARHVVELTERHGNLPTPRWFWQVSQLPSVDTEYIRISVGCLEQCAYCSIRKAKGNTRSVRPEVVLSRIRASLHQGKRRIALSCDELGSWGQDLGTDIASLLRQIVSIPEQFGLTLRNVHPEWMIRYWDELEDVFASGKIVYMILPL